MAPPLNIPTSSSTVSVSVIDTTSTVRGVTASSYVEPPIKGHDYLATPCWAFLIHHPVLDRSLLFDLGIRRDWWNLSPPLLDELREAKFQLAVTKDVRQILEEGGVKADDIEAIIWSHYHFDHTGDPSRFSPSTAVVVGPGFRDAMLPGYPAGAESPILESDYAGRELREISFTGSQALRIGRFRAFDYFGDGSFFLLDAPGHTVGHLCALARVTSNPNTFIMMGGDASSHGSEIRPTSFLPLPEEISPNPFQLRSPNPCPGHIFDKLLRHGDRSIPFYRAVADAHEDTPAMLQTVDKLQDLDAHDDIFVVLAHDESMDGIIDFFPAKVDDFLRKGWVKQCRWRFLRDFAEASGWSGPVERGRNWGPVSPEEVVRGSQSH